jgi:hypothetical protein
MYKRGVAMQMRAIGSDTVPVISSGHASHASQNGGVRSLMTLTDLLRRGDETLVASVRDKGEVRFFARYKHGGFVETRTVMVHSGISIPRNSVVRGNVRLEAPSRKKVAVPQMLIISDEGIRVLFPSSPVEWASGKSDAVTEHVIPVDMMVKIAQMAADQQHQSAASPYIAEVLDSIRPEGKDSHGRQTYLIKP